MNLLLCSLGASWQVVPEVLGLVAPDAVDLFRNHPQAAALAVLRDQHRLQPPDELWTVTTDSPGTARAIAALRNWLQRCAPSIGLRVWRAVGIADLTSSTDVAALRELILRVALLASERCGESGQLLLSLAGGRKTMSADLQRAGQLLGAHAMLHVVADDARLRDLKDEDFYQPLTAGLSGVITPLVVGQGARSDLLDLRPDESPVTSAAFPVPLAAPECDWRPLAIDAHGLHEELLGRERESAQLLGNFVQRLNKAEHHENWRTLYRLPPRHIRKLRETRLSPAHAGWLTRLPKADLHRHLGGCLSLPAQQVVAAAVWQTITPAEREAARCSVGALLSRRDWGWTWPELLKTPGSTNRAARRHRAACAALLLREASPDALRTNLLGDPANRLALRESTHGFAAYERPGELAGSALLGEASAVGCYAAQAVAAACEEGLAYVELRGSPQKYCPENPAGFLFAFRAALRAAGAATAPGEAGNPRISFIWILDRRDPASIRPSLQAGLEAYAEAADFLVGFDLAGAEGTAAPHALAPHFLPVFERCLSLTIHAGEGEPADNIWAATYHLHADRIGHGLTLAHHPALLARFRNRGICLELCPTSNREVVGFRDPAVAASARYPDYPLRTFLDEGLAVAICTDNPGFTNIPLSEEFLTAARMLPDGLSLWETLMIVKQGFRHAFLGAREREQLLKSVESHVYELAVAL